MILARVAVHAETLRPIAAVAIHRRVPIQVIDHKQIRPSVAIVVNPGGCHGPYFIANSGFPGYFDEALGRVHVQEVSLYAWNEQIDTSIPVEISRCCTHRETLAL